jgi:hypothetical protein
MSGQNWSITFTSNGLQVDAYGQSGPNLQCQNGDIISWNNQTNETHQPAQTNQQHSDTGPALCDLIEPFKSSSPGYVPDTEQDPPQTIYYYCSVHPRRAQEYGHLNVVA